MRHSREPDEDQGLIDSDQLDARRRATLLESQAEELRQRLDALLDEIARHHRRPTDLLRRYAVPITCTALLAGAAALAYASWRRRRVVWVRLSGRAQTELSRLLA